MATFAVRAELTVVNIVGQVAIRTVAAELCLAVEFPSVTGRTGGVTVCARQGKVGLRVVIEHPVRPRDGVMTQGAVTAEIASVCIVLAMTICALLRRVTEHMRFVARIAFRIVVLAQQRKARQPVVKEQVVLPGLLFVAVFTGGAQRFVVRFVLFVAGQAVRYELDVERGLDVAGRTFDIGMRTEQRVPGISGVIEANFSPRGRYVAGIALLAKQAVMIVILFVTRETAV